MGLNYSDRVFRSDLSQRWALSGFLTDTAFAEKQLAALADHYTNAIPTVDPVLGHRNAYRPSAVSCYSGNLSYPAGPGAPWWPTWLEWMMRPLTVRNGGNGASGNVTRAPIDRLRKMSPI